MLAVLDDHGLSLTHAQLGQRAAATADPLAARHGVAPGDRVAVLAQATAEVLVVHAACQRLGAAFVPLSWRLAPAELAAIVADCRPALLLHDDGHAAIAAGLGAPADRLAALAAGTGHPADVPRPRAAAAGEIAQVLSTSGTTGRPKGALLTRRQVAFNASVTARLCGLGPTDRVLGLLPLFHTGGLNALATPVLAAGGAVVLLGRFDAGAALARLATDRITAIIAVPTIYEQLLDAGLSRATAPALRVLLVGGAPVAPALLARYRHAGLRLRQGYGLTEVGPNCFTFGEDGTIGRPVPGSEARLVDEQGRAVPPGEVGELLLRGPHVTAGYLGQPAATAAVLDAAGWFHTGDLLRADADGRYRVVGRRKEMFISGGENVYPAEVELILASHPQVSEAAVIGVPDPRWGEVGLAAVVRRAAVDAGELSGWLRDRLAAFKVPRHWRFVDALPRTASGKVSRAGLAELVAAR
jgi:fatty-acyl-CoA synthase